MLIVITWLQPCPRAGLRTLAALWVAEGTDADLNSALAYVGKHHRGCGKVHTFPTNEMAWRSKAIEAHRCGHGL